MNDKQSCTTPCWLSRAALPGQCRMLGTLWSWGGITGAGYLGGRACGPVNQPTNLSQQSLKNHQAQEAASQRPKTIHSYFAKSLSWMTGWVLLQLPRTETTTACLIPLNWTPHSQVLVSLCVLSATQQDKSHFSPFLWQVGHHGHPLDASPWFCGHHCPPTPGIIESWNDLSWKGP